LPSPESCTEEHPKTRPGHLGFWTHGQDASSSHQHLVLLLRAFLGCGQIEPTLILSPEYWVLFSSLDLFAFMESGLSSQALTVISLHLCAFAHTWHKGMDVIAGDFGSRPHNSRVAGIHVPDRAIQAVAL
jgi:hypothetical protein